MRIRQRKCQRLPEDFLSIRFCAINFENLQTWDLKIFLSFFFLSFSFSRHSNAVLSSRNVMYLGVYYLQIFKLQRRPTLHRLNRLWRRLSVICLRMDQERFLGTFSVGNFQSHICYHFISLSTSHVNYLSSNNVDTVHDHLSFKVYFICSTLVHEGHMFGGISACASMVRN